MPLGVDNRVPWLHTTDAAQDQGLMQLDEAQDLDFLCDLISFKCWKLILNYENNRRTSKIYL